MTPVPLSTHQEEEYTDYSCSTAIERLSRDVETILRTWHVDRGSDHHVSSASRGGKQYQRGGGGTAPTPPPPPAAATTTTTTTTIPPTFRKNVPGNIQLIRSSIISWNVTMTTAHHGRSSVTIDLELALWDAPSTVTTSNFETTTTATRSTLGRGDSRNHLLQNGHPNNNSKRNNINNNNNHININSNSNNTSSTSETASVTDGEEELSSSGSNHKVLMMIDGAAANNTATPSTLVRSLRRKPFGSMPSHDFLFDNFSTLFGIGQHISLTPVQPDPIPDTILESVGRSILFRHGGNGDDDDGDDDVARWALASSLSQWLQTALNIATSNCHTCIPTFGVWGQYRPNQLAVSEPTPKIVHTESMVSSSSLTLGDGNGGNIGCNNNNHHQSGTANKNGGKAVGAVASSSSIGSLGVRSTSFRDGTTISSSQNGSDLLVGKTIRASSSNGQQQQQPHHDPQYPSSSTTTTLEYKRHGVQLFPHWAQACKKTILPQDSTAFFTNSRTNNNKVKNTQFSPPFVVGNVLVPSSSSSSSSGRRCRGKTTTNTMTSQHPKRRTTSQHHDQKGNNSGSSNTSNNNNNNDTTVNGNNLSSSHHHSHMYKKGANMWISAYSMKSNANPVDTKSSSLSSSSSVAGLLASSARLSVWAGVLLQHCPKGDDNLVILAGGRHVFGWFKERMDGNIKGGGKQYHPLLAGGSVTSSAASFFLGALGAAASVATNSSTSSSFSSTYQQRLGYDNKYYGSSSSSNQQHRRRTIQNKIDVWRSGADEDYDDEMDYHHYHPTSPTSVQNEEEFIMYRRQCQDAVLDILEEAWGCTDQRIPLWGSIDDPVASVYATTTWNGQQSSGGSSLNNNLDNNDNDDVVEPLLTFPLRIRSRRELSKQDYADMEESVERTVLDPMNPSRFCVQTYFDRNTNCSTLAANQRCVLAAFIRAGTLPHETLLHHLTDVELMTLWDDDAGRHVAQKVAEKAHVGNGTRRIVDAMDWSTAVEELISVREAEYIVHAVLDGTMTATLFPSPPEDVLMMTDESTKNGGGADTNTLSSFRKSAPFGRLLSVLFAHMARLRALSSIALVWRVFCQELRQRWESKESLPNMQYVPGLDPHPLQLYNEKRCFSSIGLKANFAAFLNCTEPDPDDYHCLIGQKLQVFNLSVECLVAEELLENEAMELFLGAGKVPSSLVITTDDDDNNTSTDDEILAESTRRGKILPNGQGGGGIVLVGGPTAILEIPGHTQNIIIDDTTKVPASGGGSTSSTATATASSEVSKKWPKARNNSIGNNSSCTTTAPTPTTIDKENQVQERIDYGPPTIDRDLDFWVMDEPGYAPVLDGGLQLAEDPLQDVMHYEYCVSPPSTSHSDDTTDETNNAGVVVIAPRNPSKRQKKGGSRIIKDNNKNKIKNVVVEGLPNQAWEGTIMDGSVGSQVGSTGTLSQAYFDTAEAGSIFSTRNGFISMDTVVSVADMQRRPGARCPVLNAALRSTGDQLYAPYLQRPHPLTDDVVLERKIMLAKTSEGVEKRGVLQSRIEVAHRLQKPKLLSDMRSFKAANPKCTIDDFTLWYGNPGSPLDDYNDDAGHDEMSVQDAHQESAAKKLDKASEAMRVLVSLRDFWGKTWEEALPIPAAEQDPLFDYSNTVEMVLDYLEQLHPANLMNQVMAVNLSSAYFALASSAKATMKIGIVQLSLKRLRQKTERALQVLSRDSTGMLAQLADGTGSGGTAGGGSVTGSTTSSSLFASLDAISACEEACNAMSVAETMIARATSLLHKFPGQYKLISDLLRFADGSTIPLADRAGRTGFMNVIFEQQQQQNNNNRNSGQRQDPSKDRLPDPILREYVFRNLDDENPCQLAVRFGIEGGSNMGGKNNNEGGVLLALMKAWGNEE